MTSLPLELDDVLARAASGGVAFEDVIQRPIAIEPQPRTLVILDHRGTEHGFPWHSVGWAILLVSVVAATLLSGRGLFRDLGAMTLGFAIVAFAVLLIVRARPKLVYSEVPLLWVNSTMGILRVREHPDQVELTTSSNIAFDEVREVLFSQRDFRFPGVRRGGEVSGAAVFLRLWDGAVWPIIPATLEKRDAYNIALGVAQRVGVGVKQVGAGWSDAPARPPR